MRTMRRWWLGLTLVGALAHAAGGSPAGEAWPYAVQRLPDGALEYAYDLTAVKAARGTPDARAQHGDAQVDAWLAALPREVRVRVAPGTPLYLAGGRGPEVRALATTLAGLARGPLVAQTPLPREEAARLRPPLHPLQPHLLPSAAAVSLATWQLEAGALLAVELDTEPARRALWSRVLSLALARAQAAKDEARDGALLLAARVAVASACLDAARVPAAARSLPALSSQVDAELASLAAEPDALVAPSPWSWTAEGTCAWVRLGVLSRPFPRSRVGSVAMLTFLEFLASDAKLKAQWDQVRARRDAFAGAPPVEPALAWWAAAQGKPTEALASLGEFLERLPEAGRLPPGLLALPSTPYSQFLAELDEHSRAQEGDELASAAQDGRLAAGLHGAGWPQAREAWAATLLGGESERGVQVEGQWRARLAAAFAVTSGVSAANGEGGRPWAPEEAERSALAVRLQVPPAVELEPLPSLYVSQAASLGRLERLLSEQKVGGLRAVAPDGSRAADALSADVKRWATILRGLARLAGDAGQGTAADEPAARRFLSGWMDEPRLTRDVRADRPSLHSAAGQRTHLVVAGVARDELVVGFVSRPRAEVVGNPAGFVLETQAEQRYLVPVLSLVSVTAPAATPALDRATLKGAIDAVGRDPAKVEAAVREALNKGSGH